jgi:hypothetical protein
MQFDPAIHTKEFLLNNKLVLEQLALNSESFALSELCEDVELLNTRANARSLAHILAKNQPLWLKSKSSRNNEVLKIKDGFCTTVAHYLAEYQSSWALSASAEDLDLLRTADTFGKMVVHVLAQHQPLWLKSEASKRHDILRLEDHDGWSVAQYLVGYQQESISHEPLFQKSILTLELKDIISSKPNGKLLSEYILDTFKGKEGINTPAIAMKLIAQGAAFKQSQVMPLSDGNSILKQCKALIDDCFEPLIGLKQLQGLYSTCFHNISKIIATPEKKSLNQWQDILSKAEKMLRQHLLAHPALFNVEHAVDLFCEPAMDLMSQLISENNLMHAYTPEHQSLVDEPPAQRLLY